MVQSSIQGPSISAVCGFSKSKRKKSNKKSHVPEAEMGRSSISKRIVPLCDN